MQGINCREGHQARGLSCGEARKQDSGRFAPEIIPESVSSAPVEFLWHTERDENERKRCGGGRECLCLEMLVLELKLSH